MLIQGHGGNNLKLKLLKTYKWLFEDIEECLDESASKEWIVSIMCSNHNTNYSKEMGYDIEQSKWYLKIETFNR